MFSSFLALMQSAWASRHRHSIKLWTSPEEQVLKRWLSTYIHTMLIVRDRPFMCIVSLSGDPRHIQSVFGSSRLRRTRMKDFPMDEVDRSFKKASMDETPYSLLLKAASHLSAAAEAMAQCRRTVDVFNLFQNRASIRVRPTVLVLDAERTVTVNHYTEQLLASQPNRAALRLTRDTLTETNLEPHLGLQNALEQHSMALATDEIPRRAWWGHGQLSNV